MNRRTWCLHGVLLAGLLLAICGGCGSSAPPAVVPVATNGPEPTLQDIPGPPATIPGPPAATPQPPVEAQIPGPPPAAQTVDSPLPEPPATPTETVKAEAGVALKGRSLDEHEGLLVTPAKAYFAVREKAVFQIQIPHAIQLYKAENPIPLTFDEFKQNILDPNKIKLPQLPPGHSYEWDPEQEQLMVKRPVK